MIVIFAATSGLVFLGYSWYLQYGMSPEEQFEKLCRTEPLKQKLLKQLENNPSDEEALSKYVDLLVLEGNLGRADLIMRTTGVDSKRFSQVLSLFKSLNSEAENGDFENEKSDEKWMKLVEWPVYGVFRFNQGYRFAILGDWQSARNEMLAIKNPRSGISVPKILDDQIDYLLARSYQELGEHGAALKILSKLLDTNKMNGLRPKVYAATIAGALATGDTEKAEMVSKRLEYVSGFTWEKARADRTWGDYFLEQGDASIALQHYIRSLRSDDSGGSQTRLGVLGIVSALSKKDPSLKVEKGDFLTAAKAAAGRDLSLELLNELSWILNVGAGKEIQEDLLLSRMYLEFDLGNPESAKDDLATLNLAGASDGTIASALYFLAGYESDNRDYERAEYHFLESAALGAPISAEARWRRYLLSKANKGIKSYNLEGAVSDLEFILNNHLSSDYFVPAAEELLPIYFYKERNKDIRLLMSGLDGKGRKADVLRNYWAYRMAIELGDSNGAEQALKELAWKSYTYYELYTADGPASPERGFDPLIQQPERVDEIFFGIGLTDLGRESAINAEWLFPDISLSEEIFARDNYGNSESAAWFAEKLLEKGIVSDPDLVDELIGIAFPRPFEEEVRNAAERHRISPALIWAIMKKESGFRPGAVSSAGARGLMQIMPDTADWLLGTGRAKNLGDWKTGPNANIELGAAYIAHLKYERTAHQPDEVIISAYNAGPGNANRWKSWFSSAPGWLYAELIPNYENEVFTKKVLKYELIYKMLDGEE